MKQTFTLRSVEQNFRVRLVKTINKDGVYIGVIGRRENIKGFFTSLYNWNVCCHEWFAARGYEGNNLGKPNHFQYTAGLEKQVFVNYFTNIFLSRLDPERLIANVTKKFFEQKAIMAFNSIPEENFFNPGESERTENDLEYYQKAKEEIAFLAANPGME